MAIGDLIFGLMGQPNPRDKLMQAVTGAAEAPTLDASGNAQGNPYQTPNDLMQMYSELMSRQERNKMIGTGLGLMASAIRPQNRATYMAAGEALGGGDGIGGGGAGGFDPLTMMKQIQELKAGSIAAQRSEINRSHVPEMAKQLGIPEEQVYQLFDSGKLDDFIQEASKPHTLNWQNTDGTQSVLDLKTGKESRYGEAKAPTQVIKNDDGSQDLVNTQTGQVIAHVVGPNGAPTEAVKNYQYYVSQLPKGQTPKSFEEWSLKPTTDIQEYNAYVAQTKAAGDEPKSFEDWQLEMKAAGAQKTINEPGETQAAKTAGELGVKKMFDVADKVDAASRTITNVQNSRSILHSPGGIVAGSVISPYEQQGRKVLADAFGIQDDAAQNTDAFIASMKENVLSRVKELGTGNSISDADRIFINQAFGGDISMTPETLDRIMSALERGSYIMSKKNVARIEKWNEKHPNAQVEVPELPELSQDAVDNMKVDPALWGYMKDHPDDKGAKKAFERQYGPGTVDLLLEMGR